MSDIPPPPVRALPEPSNEVQFGPWLQEAFQRLIDRWPVWVGQGAVASIVAVGPVLIAYAWSLTTQIAFQTWQFDHRGQSPPEDVLMPFLIAQLTVAGAGIWATVVMPYFLCGMLRTAQKQLRGQAIAFGDVFSGGSRYLAALGHTLLASLLIGLGVLACCVGWLYVMGVLYLGLPAVVLGGCGPVEALGKSFETTKDQWLMFTAWALVMWLLGQIGLYVCVVGLFLSIPLGAIAMAIAYRDVYGMEGAQPRPTQGPPPLPTGME